MGQYHRLCRLDARQHLDHYTLGAGAKMVEQIGNTGMAGALALACATGFGTHARDLPWARTGLWAGKPLASIGDYAEPSDLLEHPALAGSGTTEGDIWDKPGTNIATRFRPVLERVQHVRLVGTGWITGAGPVGQMEDGTWALDRGLTRRPLTDSEWNDHVAYMERVRARADATGDWARAPLPMAKAPDRVPAAHEVGAGGAALWISIDSQEFVDTARLGAFDLADVVANPKATAFVQGALFHHEERGGGDMDNGHGLHAIGRWRGDRIALVGPKGIVVDGQRLTHGDIRARYRDLTDLALLMWTLGNEGYTCDPNAPDTPSDGFDATHPVMLRHCVERWMPGYGNDHPLLQHSRVTVHPGLSILLDGTVYRIPASARLETPSGGVVWMEAEVRRRVVAVLDALPPLDGHATMGPSTARNADTPLAVSWPMPTTKGLMDDTTAHGIMATIAAHT